MNMREKPLKPNESPSPAVSSYDRPLHNHDSQSVLLRHSLLYLLARGVSGILNFLAILIYTRLLSPYDYGRYALVLAGVGLFNAVSFQWLRLSLVRFLPTYMEDPRMLLSTVFTAFVITASLTGGLGLMLTLLWPDPTWQGLIFLAVPLLWTQAWFELNLELTRSRLQPVRYGVMSGIKAITALALGIALVLWGFRAYGPLVGLLAAMLLVGLPQARREWMGIGLSLDRELLRELLGYGLPLTATFALGFVVQTSDRFLITYFLGVDAAGLYSASYDLVQQSMGLFMASIGLASFPLIVRDYEQNHLETTQKTIHESGRWLLIIGAPAATGIAILSPNIANTMVGAAFSDIAAMVMPIVAAAVFVQGLLEFYYNRGFWLSRRTRSVLWVMFLAGSTNLLLNLLWIPIWGLIGAAFATFVAYSLASMSSSYLSRKFFPIPTLPADALKVLSSSLAMAVVLWPMRSWIGYGALLVQVLSGAATYGVLILTLDIGKLRTKLLKRITRPDEETKRCK